MTAGPKFFGSVFVSLGMRSCLLLIAFALATLAKAQPPKPVVVEDALTFYTDKPFTVLELYERSEDPIPTPKKKPKRKVYYGIKTKKAFTRRGTGESMVLELFYVLKRAETPNTYARDIYWYSYKRRQVMKTTPSSFKTSEGVLLHGPYKKMIGQAVIEEGIFFKGTKHGRWMVHSRDDLLEDKEKYYKGWPKESIITFYDPDTRTKVKEIIPIEYGEREGYYYLFHENGQVAVRGEYHFNEKVADWEENYPNGKRKRIITYPKESFSKRGRPYIRKEWDDRGSELYSR